MDINNMNQAWAKMTLRERDIWIAGWLGTKIVYPYTTLPTASTFVHDAIERRRLGKCYNFHLHVVLAEAYGVKPEDLRGYDLFEAIMSSTADQRCEAVYRMTQKS